VVNVYPPSPELGRSIAIDISETFKTRINNIQTVQLEPRTNTYTQVDLAMISGNNVKLLPIESNDENFLTVYSTIRTITSDDTQISRRSISIDMPVALKTKLNNVNTQNNIHLLLQFHVMLNLLKYEGNDVIIKNLRSSDPNIH
jgi:hypothetical protein